jgi:WG containing repeat
MDENEETLKPDWQPLADRLSTILGREIISGQKYQREDEREFWVNTGGRAANETIGVALTPYTEDDLAAIDFEWTGLPPSSLLWSEPQWVIGRDDSWNSWLLRVGIEFDAKRGNRACVRWPSTWPAKYDGRAKLHCSSAWHDLRAETAPDGWNLAVWSFNLNNCTLGLRGLIDIDGQFILPCKYEIITKAEGLLTSLSKTTSPPLPDGRRTHWMWAEVLEPDEPRKDGYGREVSNVIEIWSGKRVNPVGTKALRNTLSHGYFHITPDSTGSKVKVGSEVGLMLASLIQPAPMLWKHIFGTCPFDPVAAQCAQTGLYGYIGASGQTVIEAQFISAKNFNDHWAIVEIQGLQDIKKGAIAIDFEKSRDTPLTAAMTTLPWRWLLQPVWDDIVDEFDGHFTVQNSDKLWGMVSPLGKPVTPFAVREHAGSYNHIHDICRMQFKRLQQQRFVELLMDVSIKPNHQRSLEAMQGKLFSSWGRYDHGSLSTTLHVRVRQDVTGFGLCKQADFSYRNEPYEFKVGTLLEWDTGERNYAGFVDLSTHAALKQAENRNIYAAYIPWAALELVLPYKFENSFENDGFDVGGWEKWRKKREATYVLYSALMAWGVWLESHRYIPKAKGIASENEAKTDRWDAEDAICAVLWLARVLQNELLDIIKGKNTDDENSIHSMKRCQNESDITTLFEKNRYASGTIDAYDRFRQTPMWIASDDSPNAIAPDHPWVLEMQMLRKTALDAYENWQSICEFQ